MGVYIAHQEIHIMHRVYGTPGDTHLFTRVCTHSLYTRRLTGLLKAGAYTACATGCMNTQTSSHTHAYMAGPPIETHLPTSMCTHGVYTNKYTNIIACMCMHTQPVRLNVCMRKLHHTCLLTILRPHAFIRRTGCCTLNLESTLVEKVSA